MFAGTEPRRQTLNAESAAPFAGLNFGMSSVTIARSRATGLGTRFIGPIWLVQQLVRIVTGVLVLVPDMPGVGVSNAVMAAPFLEARTASQNEGGQT